MSYCRWSDSDLMSDLYVFEDARGGWTAMVAEQRRNWKPPQAWEDLMDSIDRLPAPEWKKRHLAYYAAMDSVPWVDLPVPSTGREFNTATRGEMIDKLELLRTEGFNVPQQAIDRLRAEQNA